MSAGDGQESGQQDDALRLVGTAPLSVRRALTQAEGRLVQLLRTDGRLGAMGPTLADLLSVTLATLDEQSSDSGCVLAAHGMRELIEKVGREFNCWVRGGTTNLADKINNLRKAWKGWESALEQFSSGKLQKNAQNDDTVRKAIREVDAFLKNTASARPSAADRSELLVKKSGGTVALLGKDERTSLGKELDLLFDEFTQISHLKKAAPPTADFKAMVDRCIEILSLCLIPATFLGLEELDALIEQVEAK